MDHVKLRRRPGNVVRSPRRWVGLMVALIALLAGVASAQAQMPGGRGANQPGGSQQGNQQRAPQSPAPAPVKIVPEPWPRLDVGAILCKSRDDLVRYQMKIGGDPAAAAPGPAPDCQVIRKQIAIQILDRDGPSRTQIVSTDAAKQTGWTNTYLPATPPASDTAGVVK
ncbi:MAG: hypothetical protein ACLQJR_10635 [Stellaceae bacterium]